MIRVLSLDQAPSNTGWAFGSDQSDTKITTGTRDMPDFGDAYRPMKQSLRKWLDDLLDRALPKIVTVEQILKTPDWRVQYRQFSLVAAIEDICAERGIDVFDVEIKEWRQRARIPTMRPKFARDDTGWLKDLAKQRCLERGWLIDSHHAAEAALMLDWALAKWSPQYKHRTAPLLRRIDSEMDKIR